ncbi:MAG: hypothetical protein OXF68_16690 [Gammaproteobacteria bacterium]|nr:hypothetical protein [Gammaproteobacteria bacterium]
MTLLQNVREKKPLPDGSIRSPLLGLDFLHEGLMLHCRDPETGEIVPRYEEITRMRQAAQARVAELEALLRQSGSCQPAPNG